MSADGAWPSGTWERMIRAVEAVEERLIRSTAALERAGVPHAVIGALAVAYWVAQRDAGARRNTPNVDILLSRADFEDARAALEAVGFVHTSTDAPRAAFLDDSTGKPRQAVHLWFCAATVKPEGEPLPDIGEAFWGGRFRVVPLVPLVRMKLHAFRTIDCVHLQDMLRVGLIDATWPERFPERLAAPLGHRGP